ncbi:MAG TPA: hypothetical protein VN645_11080 [Steroidobacteraceae bacterium]|nr:hypothetical protein [Steroidobacteraceae bacterium]
MAREEPRETEPVDTSQTARIDRRQTVLAQIEAALLANKLSVLELAVESTGTDPYNRSRAPVTNTWDNKRVR